MAETVKHTPGTWAYRESREDCCDFEIYSVDGTSIDIVAGEYGIESEDDARLIAASKELLDAVQSGLKVMKVASRQLSEDHKMILSGRGWGWQTIAKMEGAITKAEGRS